jgi:hypothetical protein
MFAAGICHQRWSLRFIGEIHALHHYHQDFLSRFVSSPKTYISFFSAPSESSLPNHQSYRIFIAAACSHDSGFTAAKLSACVCGLATQLLQDFNLTFNSIDNSKTYKDPGQTAIGSPQSQIPRQCAFLQMVVSNPVDIFPQCCQLAAISLCENIIGQFLQVWRIYDSLFQGGCR